MNTTMSVTYRAYTINTGSRNNMPCNTMTLDQVVNALEYMTTTHSKVLCVRVDIMNDAEGVSILERQHMTRVLEETKRSLESKLKHNKNKIDFHYVWTTEQTSDEKLPHYHCFILVNGHAIQNGYSIHSVLNNVVMKYQQSQKEGLVNFSSSNGQTGIMINRNAPDFEKQKNRAVYAGSYLAKTKNKNCNKKGVRFSSSSRTPK